MSKVVITGGTGFIGSHIVECFKNNGEDISLITRKEADIRSLEQLIKAFQGADIVIHNAAKASDWGKYKDFFETNVSGTQNVLEACKLNGISKVILTGTCSVYGEEGSPIVKDENSPLKSHYNYFADKIFPCAMNYYRDTKRLARTLAIDYAKKNNIDLIILDPVWVYGEREFNTGFFEYLENAKSGMPFIMGSAKNKFHVIYAKDLAKAYYLAYKADLKGINIFIIGNEKAEYMDKIYETFCNIAGYKKPKNAPKLLMYPIGFIIELFYSVFQIKKPPILTRGRVNMFYDNIEYSIAKAKNVLGFECEHGFEESVKNTVKWYKNGRYL